MVLQSPPRERDGAVVSRPGDVNELAGVGGEPGCGKPSPPSLRRDGAHPDRIG